MLSSKLTAIILKRANFGEADRIITVFTQEQGKLTLVAKGVRRIRSRRAPHLEPLTEAEIITHKNIVTQAKSLHKPDFDLKSLSFALYGAEVIDKLLPENEPHEDIYEFFRVLLFSKIDESKIKEFTLKVLWSLGFLPPGQFPKEGINNFVEQIAEKHLRSKKLIDEI